MWSSFLKQDLLITKVYLTPLPAGPSSKPQQVAWFSGQSQAQPQPQLMEAACCVPSANVASHGRSTFAPKSVVSINSELILVSP
jgi:hypothetical protein